MPKFIKDLDISEISIVDKGANQRTVIFKSAAQFKSLNDPKPIKFIAKQEDKRLMIGVVYEPDSIDSQGDYTDEAEIEKAAHKFLAEYRIVKEMHQNQANAAVVESYIAPSEFKFENGESVKKGSWLAVIKIHDDAIWAKVKAGEYTGFSMGGQGRSVEKTGGKLGDNWRGFENLDQSGRIKELEDELAGYKKRELIVAKGVALASAKKLLELAPTVDNAKKVSSLLASTQEG